MKYLIFVLLITACFAWSGQAQVRNTENTFRLDDGKTGEKATIADMEWLAGRWSGTGLGGVSEENWGKANGGIMLGTYRLIKDGKPVFYEMCWLMEKEGTLILRLKHFHANLAGWEEKDKTVDFKFVKKDGNRMHFSGLTFERSGPNELNIYLALGQKDGSVVEEAFKMKRSH